MTVHTQTIEKPETVAFTAEIEVIGTELREAGWIPVGEAEKHCAAEHCPEEHEDLLDERVQVEDVVRVLENWHNEHHTFGFALCYDEPCKSVREVVG